MNNAGYKCMYGIRFIDWKFFNYMSFCPDFIAWYDIKLIYCVLICEKNDVGLCNAILDDRNHVLNHLLFPVKPGVDNL